LALVAFDQEHCKGCSLCIEFCPKKIEDDDHPLWAGTAREWIPATHCGDA
jgi:Fe-S-cluster-containing dehydrogenase component